MSESSPIQTPLWCRIFGHRLIWATKPSAMYRGHIMAYDGIYGCERCECTWAQVDYPSDFRPRGKMRPLGFTEGTYGVRGFTQYGPGGRTEEWEIP